MPPRRPIRSSHRPGRGFRSGRGGSSVYFDGGPSDIVTETVLVMPSDLDAILVPPTDEPEFKKPQAGDLLPTSGSSVRTALDQENANWSNLNDAIIGSLASGKIGTDFSFPFTTDLYAWKTFYTLNMQSTIFGWEPMVQLDEWRKKRANWALELERKIGIKLPGQLNQAPPRESAPLPATTDMTKLVTAVGIIAAIVVFGPPLMKELPILIRQFSH